MSACSRWNCSAATANCSPTRSRRACTTPGTGRSKARDLSQFENHLRAVLGLPLGDTRMRRPTPACSTGSARCPMRRRSCANPAAHWHDYGKEPRAGPQGRACDVARGLAAELASASSASARRSGARRRSRRCSRALALIAASTAAIFAVAMRTGRVSRPSSRARSRVSASVHLARDEIPVHQVPERLDVLRPRVAVVDVVGVLPHVAGQQRRVARR